MQNRDSSFLEWFGPEKAYIHFIDFHYQTITDDYYKLFDYNNLSISGDRDSSDPLPLIDFISVELRLIRPSYSLKNVVGIVLLLAREM